MKTKLMPALALGAVVLASCSTYDKGPYLPPLFRVHNG